MDETGASISTLSGPLRLQDLALGDLEIMGAKIIIDSKGNIYLKEGVIYGNEGMRGAETVSKETGKIGVIREWEKTPKAINVTPSWETIIWVEEINTDGFVIRFGTPPEEQGKVYWLAVW